MTDSDVALQSGESRRGSSDSAGSPSTAEKTRGLPWVVASSALNTIFWSFTFSSSVFVLFLDLLGLAKTQIGLVLSLFPFCGLLAIPLAPLVGRFGVKRTFLATFGARNFVIFLLVAAPMVASRWGVLAASTYVSIVILVFAVLRAVGETGYYPWFQEFVPNSIRGRFMAVQTIVSTSCGAVSLWVAGYVIGHSQGLVGFQVLIAVGTIFGLASVGSMMFVPGGRPTGGSMDWGNYWDGITASLRDPLFDRNFLLYLCGFALYTLGTAVFAFVPLFMRDLVGLSPGSVVRLEAATMLGGIVFSFFLGRASDRYGGKRVLLLGTLGAALLPVVWMLMPRHSSWSSLVAYAAACWWGVANTGVLIGGMRLVFSEVVPGDSRIGYSSAYYAWAGLAGGIGPLAAGRALAHFANLKTHFLGWNVDTYTPLFLASIALILGGAASYRTIGRSRNPRRHDHSPA